MPSFFCKKSKEVKIKMIALTNTTAQALAPGASLVFDEVIYHKGCGECHRKNTASVKLRTNAIYEVHFSGNVDGATADAPVTLAIALGGSTLPETIMISSAAGLNNVAKTVPVANCCGDYDRITVTNIGTTAITVGANALLYIHKAVL